MPHKKTSPPPGQASFLEVSVPTAPCVPAIREAVRQWVTEGYPGATQTTLTLLTYWFHTDHRLPDGSKFAYFPFQQETIETLVYLYEVVKIRRHKPLLETYARLPNLRLLQYDLFPRYCLKMATGSGKTKVMSLAIAWQYFNSILENRQDYAPTILLIAPNIIVFERLQLDFASGLVFRKGPVIPPELQIYWDFECYLRGESERASSSGALYLTNIQQLYENHTEDAAPEPDIMTLMLGPKPPTQPAGVEPFFDRILKRAGPTFVVNDEAHHTHDEESEWNRSIRHLHQLLVDAGSPGILQLDLTATPRYSKGSLFTWTVFDFPLKQAILDNVVKRPLKGVAPGIQEAHSDIASTRYQAYLTAGVERWREYREQLADLHRKPVLFLMLNSTKDADDVADYLRKKYPAEFSGDKLVVIHTNLQGDVSKADLETARRVSREIDLPDNKVNAIVSVLMLREGWDVRNVTVVVGLRPYTSKANILPEQTIGRGLRLMFRPTFGQSPSFRERVDVIGNRAFIEFVEQLERDEDYAFETFDPEKDKVVIEKIFPDPQKISRDIIIPILSSILARKRTLADEIAAIDITRIQTPQLPKKRGDAAAQKFTYEGYDIITLEKLIERHYQIPEVQTSQEVISYYAKRIAADVKLPSQFAALVPKIHDFLEQRAFGGIVDLDDPLIIKAISHPVAQHVTVKAFVAILREAIIEEKVPVLENPGRLLSTCEGFPWSRPTHKAEKTVFNLVAADNQFEVNFAEFLEKAPDIVRFTKLPEIFNFTIPYTDSAANLRYYEPDFVAVTSDGVHHLIETKGREDIDVKHKDYAARLWCENATFLTHTTWEYKIIHQQEFEKLHPCDFDDLIALEPIKLL